MADENTPEQQEKINKLLENAKKSLKEQVRLQAEVSRLNGEHITQAEQLAGGYREELRLQQELNEILSANTDHSVGMIDTYKKQLFEAQRVGRLTLSNYNNQITLLDEIKKLQEERSRLQGEGKDNTDKELALLNERFDLVKKNVQAQQKLTAAMNEGVRAGAGMVESLGNLIKLTPDLDQGIVGNLARSVFETKSLDHALDGAHSSLAEMFSVGNLFSFFIANTVELAVRMDKLTTSFVQTTGASRTFNTEMVDTFDRVSELGVGLQDSAEAFSDLFVNFTKFSTVGPQLRSQLAATAAGLAKLGVDSRTTGDSLDFLVSGLGMNVGEAESILKRFAVEGRNAGIPPQVLAQQFTQLEPKLAAFGRQAPDIFIRTAKTAKSLGIEVGELGSNLFGLSDGLSTFDQAADKVASFNLVMGGSFVNAFDLTMAAAEGPFKQLEMLRDGFNAAGKSFENMNFFEQKMLSDSFGISIGNLRAMMEGTLSPQEAMISQEEEFANMVTEATSAIDKLSAAVEGLAKWFAPIGEFFNSAAGTFAMFTGSIAAGIFAYVKLRALFAGSEILNAIKGMGAAQAVQTAQIEMTNAAKVKSLGFEQLEMVNFAGLAALDPYPGIGLSAGAATAPVSGLGAATGVVVTEMGGLAATAPVAAGGGASGAAAVGVGTLSTAFASLAATMLPIVAIAGAIYGAFAIFNEIGSFLDGTSSAARTLGMILGGVFGAIAGMMTGNPLIAIAGFGVGVAAASAALPSPEAAQSIGPVGHVGMDKFGADQLQGFQLRDAGNLKGFRTGGDNISSSFIAGEGPSPRGEFVQPMSVIKAQESGNLASTLKETANALRDTRKSDGSFEKMLQALEKIAGNTEQQPEQRPIEVGLNIGGRQFQKEVVRAMNRELS